MHHSSVLELSDLGKDNAKRIVTQLNDQLPNETLAQKEKKNDSKIPWSSENVLQKKWTLA